MLIKAVGNSIKWFATYGFRVYLSKPNFSQNVTNENGVTLILENDVDRQADRPAVWNRVVDCNGTMTFTFGSITGTLYGYVYNTTSWGIVDISSYLSGLVLTLPNNWKVKYFYDDNYTYYCEQGQGTTVVDNSGAGASITISTSALWNTDNTIPYEATWGDINGIIESDQGEYPISYGTGGLTGTTIWYGRKDEPLTINEIPHISLDESLGDTLSIDVGTLNLSLVTITEVRGVRHGTTTKLVPSDFNINIATNEIEVASGLVVDVNYFKFSDNTEATYMGGKNASGNVIGSTNFRINSSVGAGVFTVNVGDVNTSTVLKNGLFAPIIEFGSSLALAYQIDPTHTISNTSINTYAYTSQRRYNSFRWKALLLQSDTSGTLETGQEWQNGKFVIKKNGTLQGTSSRILIQIDLILDASNFNFKVDITGDKSIERIEGEDRSIYTSFYSLMSSTYSITFTDSSHVTNFQEFYWLLAADDPNNDGTGWTPGVGQDPNDYPDIVLGITGASCSGVRTLLNQAGISDVLKFIELFNTSGVRTTYAVDIFWYLLLRIKVNYSFPSLLGAGTHTISVTTNQLSRTTSTSTARDIGYFLLYDRTPLQYIGLAIYDNTVGGNGQFDFHYLNINSLDILPGLSDGSNVDSDLGNPNIVLKGNHLQNTTKIALPPQRTITEQEIGNLTGVFDFHRDKGDDTYDRLLISAYDDTVLTTTQTNKATNYTT